MRYLLIALIALSGCRDSPQDDYDDFLSRTNNFRADAGPDMMVAESRFEDLRGRWYLNALLNIGSNVVLIVVFRGDDPAVLEADIWYKLKEGDPLVTVPVAVAEDGTFDIVAPDLVLPAEVLNAESPVIADITLRSRIVDANGFCGTAFGPVTSPLAFELTGTTFFAARDDDGTRTSDDVDFVCPAGLPGAPDAGVAPDDGGATDAGVADTGPARPESPDLSAIESTGADLTGHFAVAASFAGQPLQLWASIVDATGTGAGGLDGAIRLAVAEADSEALLTFTTTVDDAGRFEIWIPGLAIFSETLMQNIEASILLAAASVSPGFCGRVVGKAKLGMAALPVDITFGAVPWAPGTPLPEVLPLSCDEMGQAPPPPDMGAPDVGEPDMGESDTGPPDMGLPDMGLPDMGAPDAAQ